MSTAAASPRVDPAPSPARARRVLILRSCRAPQFAAAVDETRRRDPDAEIVALSHRGHASALVAAGVDRIIELPGRRFGVLRLAPWTLARLRTQAFDEIVVPQMSEDPGAHVNLYWLVRALRSRSVLVLSGRSSRRFDRRGFAAYTRQHSLGGLYAALDAPLFLGLLLTACLARVRRRAGSRPDRQQRVLHIISSLGVGGAQRQLAELVNRTPAERYDVDVLVLGQADGEFARHWFARSDLSVTFVSQWPRLAASVLEVERLCAARQYDLVHTWLFMANAVGVAGARRAGVPRIIASVRNLSLWKRTWYRQWWFRAADVLSSYAADEVTVNADALRRDHGRWALYPSKRIRVVHNGLDPSQFLVDAADARRRVRQAAGLPEEAIVVGTVGRLAPEKDHATFLRIVEAVRRTRPDVHALIVGDGALRVELEGAARGMRLGDAVTFLGERKDARQLMAGLDLFVLTSAIEGFPNVLLESAFLGVPAVASRVGGSPDILPDPLDTFEIGDHETAAERILALLDTPAHARAAAARVRRRAFDCFTADHAARRWFALYDRSPIEETVS